MDLKEFLRLWQKMESTRELPTGVILAGPSYVIQGEGRENVLAQMMCFHQKESMAACGQCHSCYHFQDQMSEYHFRLEAEAGRMVPVDDIRHMQHIISLGRGGEHPFFVIVSSAVAISTAGWNMMLKVLEEPPLQVHFIVFTPQHRHVPITVRSRMMQFFIYLSEGADMEDSLPMAATALDSGALDQFLQGKPTHAEDWQRWLGGLRHAYQKSVEKGVWAEVTRLCGAFIEVSDVLGQKRRDGSINLKYRISEIVAKYS